MEKNKPKTKKSNVREWVESFIIAAIIATIVRTLIFQNYRIPTSSMVPILKPGDRIFATRLTYGPKIPIINKRIPGFGKPQRGDVVVFVPPHEVKVHWFKRKQFIKRLVGLPGDKVLIKNGDIYINGELITDPRIKNVTYYNLGEFARAGREAIVPENKYFFLGDNSRNSVDSRYWGFADKEWIVAKALFIWLPFSRIQKIN
tara:strand:- start:618 stop:1223 length:606 start_codon:yes stop_codon:yes gene_type:complete